jgi:competence protein ComGC
MKKDVWVNERGMTLVTVLLVLIVLSVLGLGLLSLTVSHAKQNSAERSHQSSYYIAEAGVTAQMKTLEDEVKQYYENTDDQAQFFSQLEQYFLNEPVTIDSFETAFGKQPKAVVTIQKVNDDVPRTYKITSTGTIGKHSRKVEKTFHVNWQKKGGLSLPGEMAVYTDTTISLAGGAVISGNIGTNSNSAGTVSFDGGASHRNGSIYVPKGAENSAIDAPDYMDIDKPIAIDKPTPLTLPPFPEYPEYPVYPDKKIGDKWNQHVVVKDGKLLIDNYLADNYTLELKNGASFSEIKLVSNNTLNIDVGDSDKAIVVDHLNVQNGQINIKGSGNLTFYVKEEITMGSGSTINNNGTIERLSVYLKDSKQSKKVKLSGSQKIFGSLYAETADIEITGGGGFQGHIFTGGDEVTISGGARTYSSLLYAPSATIRISGGGSVKGMILSHSFDASGGAYAEFQELDIDSIPFVSNGESGMPDDLITSEPLREASR